MIRTPDLLWHADPTMLEYWRTTETINIYRITPTDSFVTINRHGVPMEWDLFPPSELQQIRSLVTPPWIPAKIIYTTIPLHQILDFDAWSRDPTTPPADPAWSRVVRPLLEDVPQRRPWEHYLLIEPAPVPPPQPATQQLPPHVAATMIAAAVSNRTTCPITLDTIDAADATVTPCGHVFTATALRRWLETTRSCHCPECRNPLTI